jgi:hypothetical protein
MDREDDDLRAASAAAEQLVAKVLAQRDRIAPLVPDLDPGDLMLIIESLLRPFGSGRRFLLSEVRPGVYVA